ncbi:MAG: hypothetical protein V3U92_04130 [Cellulophaga sp.]
MKTIATIIIGFLAFGITASNAQIIPKPPKTPNTTSSTSSSYSMSTSSSGDNVQSTNVSISVSNSDRAYTLKARCSSSKMKEVKTFLLKEMGRNNLTTTGGQYNWEANSNKNRVYDISVSNKRLTMFIDKEVASTSLVRKFEDMGLIIRSIISGDNDQGNTQREADQMQREADRMQRDADRMKKEATRMQRAADKDNSKNYEEDAIRFEAAAKRMEEDAKQMEEEAKHNGGVPNIVKLLLDAPKTNYANKFVGANTNWVWPSFQKAVISKLIKDGFIKNERNINFTKDHTGMYINGEKLTIYQEKRYNQLFNEHRVFDGRDFSFHKKGTHIIVISGPIKVERFFENLKDEGYITSLAEKFKLEINGDTIVHNGVALSKEKVAIYNGLLQKNGIIPAPGKIIEIIKKDNYQVGYNLKGRGLLGTFVMND